MIKVASPVLRGLGAGNGLRLLDKKREISEIYLGSGPNIHVVHRNISKLIRKY